MLAETENMTAYNYATQELVDGSEGTALRLEQLRAELEVLAGEGGEAYLRAMGSHQTQGEAVVMCRRGIEQCEVELGRQNGI